MFQHLDDVQETYWQHAAFAFYLSTQCALAAFQAGVHGLLPCVWTQSTSARLQKLQQALANRPSLGD